MNISNIDMKIEELLVVLATEIKSKQTHNKTRSIFPSLLTLQALALSKNRSSAQSIADILVEHISKTKSANWTWNYTAEQAKYPDDLDDTCCAIAALIDWDRIALSKYSAMLTSITHTLIRQEKQPGGPYFTWISGAHKHNDIDIGVNANTHYMLSKLHISLPELTTYIDQHIDENDLNSLYYHNKILFLYFIARGYRGNNTQKLLRRIKENIRSDSSETEHILATISRIRLGETLSKLTGGNTHFDLEKILNNEQDLTQLYIERIQNNVTEYATSYIFEIAVRIELLELIRVTQKHEISPEQKTKELVVEHKILHELSLQKQKMPRLFQDIFEKQVAQLRSSRHWYEIILLPYSLTKHPSTIKLGALGALAWIAYTIDDEIMDSSETKYTEKVKLLPFSRLLHRQIFEMIDTQSSLWNKSLDEMDAAHYSELCGIQTSIVQKSFGHALPAILAIEKIYAVKNNTDIRSSTPKAYIETFKQCLKKYIAARQLSDDAHDWKEDMALKRSTPVTQIVLHHANQEKTQGDTKKDMRHLDGIFWKKCAKNIATNILKQSIKSLELASRCEKIDPSIHLDFLKTQITRYTHIAQTMLREIDQAEQFSAKYAMQAARSQPTPAT